MALDIDEQMLLYEEFVRARSAAMALTDRYHQLAADDPARPVEWDHVVRQTEAARQMLEAWLRKG